MYLRRAPLVVSFAAALVFAGACTDTVAPNNLNSPATDASAELTSSSTLAGAPVISAIVAKSGKHYLTFTGKFGAGDTVYIDRKYVSLSPVPSIVQGGTYIRTANNDKVASPGSTNFLTFSIDRASVIYVAHDDRLALPRWLRSSFVSTGSKIINSDYYGKQYLTLYKKAFAKGTVTLGSNVDVPANGNMYMVIVMPSTTSLSSDQTAPTVKLTAPSSGAKVAGSISLTATASDNVGVMGVQFQVDGKAAGTEVTKSPYSMAWSSKVVANGTHTLSAVARDAAGNKSTSSEQVSVQNATSTSSPTGTTAPHGGWYVTPTGSSSGQGTSASPWDLPTALSGAAGRVHPGDTIWLRGGTYGHGEGQTTYTSSLTGTSTAPIIVREYPGERATINGSLSAGGSYTWFWDFEIANTNSSSSGTVGVDGRCTGCKYIDLVIHDHSSNGMGLWAAGSNVEAYGNIIYNNGFYGESVDHAAHGIYTQNTTGTKRLINNLLFNQFGFGIHVYGSASAPLNNYTIEGNTAVNSGIGSQTGMSGGFDYQIGGMSPLGNLVFTHNMSYRVPGDRGNTARLGYSWGPLNSAGVITDNYFVGALMVSHWSSLTFERNHMMLARSPALDLELVAGQALPSGTWSDNSYEFAGSGSPFLTSNGTSGTSYTSSLWQQTLKLDIGSTFTSSPPTSDVVVVQPDAYEAGRANVIIYNWANQGAVSVNLSQVLNTGDRYEVRNAQNFYAPPVATGTYGGSTITLPITSAAPAPTISGRGRAVPTGTQFNAYVVLKSGS